MSTYKSLSTANLPDPVIDPAKGSSPEDYFNTVLYTGTRPTAQSITGVGFAPDFVWIKGRSFADQHSLNDIVRGADASLFSSTTGAEDTTANRYVTSFDADGFTVGNDYMVNYGGESFVAWNWKANGSGVSNTDGSITSTVSANTTSGFSIVTYTGNGTSGATVGHGLDVTPEMVILKSRSTADNWQVKHSALNANQNLELHSTAAVDTAPGSGYISAISSTTLTLLNGGGAITNVNGSGTTYLTYCFHSVEGFSKCSSYVGNGSADGPFVYTGFRPAFVIIKNISASNTFWLMFDSARDTDNVVNNHIQANSSNADSSFPFMDFVSNGFKHRHTSSHTNTSGQTYIYMAFSDANGPFKYSNAR